VPADEPHIEPFKPYSVMCFSHCPYSPHSRRDRRLVAQCKPAQIVSGGLRPAACREKGAAIMLQEANPGLDIAGMPHIAVDREFGGEEGRA
jgi:hypothetical protein